MAELPEFAARFLDRIKAECLPRIDRATVAFYFVECDYVQRDRTGVLYRIAGHHFVLTAAHDLRRKVGSNIPLYIDLGDNRSLPVPLAAAKFHSTEPECRDVAVIELPADVATELSKTKEFISHSDVRLTDKENSLYVLFGYPENWSGVVSANTVMSEPLVYVCHRYIGEAEAEQHYDPKVHVVLELDQHALNTADGEREFLPPLDGISGCGIWRVGDWSRTKWESCQLDQISLVATQHTWVPSRKYVQGTWIGYTLALIQENYPDVSAAMNLVYPAD